MDISLEDLLGGNPHQNNNDNDEPLSDTQKAATVEELTTRLAKFQEPHEFKIGDLVQWKVGLRHKRLPGPMIVTEIFDAPIIDESSNSGEAYYRERLDIKAAVLSIAGFTEYHYDSRRFEPYDGPTIDTLGDTT